MNNNQQRQTKPLTVSEYLSAFALAFLAAMLWRQSVEFALFMAVLGVGLLALLMAESLAGVRTAVRGGIAAAWDWLMTWLNWERKVKLVYGELALGINIKTRRWVHQHIEQLQSMLIVGVTGSGKTTFIHSVVYFIIKHYLNRDFIQLAFTDLKIGYVDFSAYRQLDLLFRPLATSVEEADQLILAILDEIRRRADLYRMVAGGEYVRLCNSIGRYHELKRELHLVDLPNLPYLLFFVDELSQFTRNSKHLSRLVTIAEQGRAFGVYLIASTQYPTAESIPPVLRQQLPTRFVFPMAPSALKVAEVYQDVKPDHELAQHECYASLGTSGRSYIALRTNVVPYDEFEAMVNGRSGGSAWNWDEFTPLDEDDFLEESDLREDWNGKSDEQKRASLWAWFDSFHERPSVEEFLAKYNASERTYYNKLGVRHVWKERFGDFDAVNPNAVPNDA